MLNELKPIAKKFSEIKKLNWYKYGDWESPVLRKELYAIGNGKKYFSKLTGLEAGLRYEIHIEPTDYGVSEDHDLFLKKFISKIKKDNNLFKKIIGNTEKACRSGEEFTVKINRIKRWDKKDKKELVKWYKLFLKAYMPLFPYSFLWYQHEKLLSELYEYAMDLSGIPENKIRELRDQLIVPIKTEKETYSAQALNNIFKIVIYVQSNKNLKSLFKLSPAKIEKGLGGNKKLKQLIDKHIKNYGFLATRHWLGEPFSEKDIIKEIKQFVLSDVKEIIRKNKKNLKDKQENFKKISNDLRLSNKTLSILNQLRYNINLKTYRKELISKVDFRARGLFSEIARRMGINYNRLIYLRKKELEDFLYHDKLPDFKKIKPRQKGYILYLINGRIYLLDPLDITKQSFQAASKIKNIKEIQGITANPGKVTGKVKLVLKNSDIKKVKKGDILVSDMTNPNYLPALKLASAFVTNRGGLLCHAVLLSREYRKPCIVNTKNATEILIEGMKVEVDADKGVIKILK